MGNPGRIADKAMETENVFFKTWILFLEFHKKYYPNQKKGEMPVLRVAE